MGHGGLENGGPHTALCALRRRPPPEPCETEAMRTRREAVCRRTAHPFAAGSIQPRGPQTGCRAPPLTQAGRLSTPGLTLKPCHRGHSMAAYMASSGTFHLQGPIDRVSSLTARHSPVTASCSPARAVPLPSSGSGPLLALPCALAHLPPSAWCCCRPFGLAVPWPRTFRPWSFRVTLLDQLF